MTRHKLFDRYRLPGLAVSLALSVVSLTPYAGAQPADLSNICDVATVQLDNDETGGTDLNPDAVLWKWRAMIAA
ncbi:MAG: hypothetical protein ACRBM6_29790 [Geminicoccales bacterium]